MPTTTSSRAARREQATAETRTAILEAARACLLEDGYANLSTRRIAELADVPLSQIHYHFGSRLQLILAMLDAENDRLVVRQAQMFAGPEPFWRRWERACDFLEEDLDSGYVRVLQEMIAAGWSDAALAETVRGMLRAWYVVLADVVRVEQARGTDFGPFDADELAVLMGVPFLGAEELILLGMPEATAPVRSALRKVGHVLRAMADGSMGR